MVSEPERAVHTRFLGRSVWSDQVEEHQPWGFRESGWTSPGAFFSISKAVQLLQDSHGEVSVPSFYMLVTVRSS